MADSSNQPIQAATYLANSADCVARINEAKIASYMWYIHVTVRVNAADRLRHSLAHILGQETTATTPLSPSLSAPFGFSHINIAGSGNGSSRTVFHERDVASAADRVDDLTDYFVLDHFSQEMLETLVNTAPIEEYAQGYTSALASIPAHFREEFCRRLYCLLFSKYIVEWPQGIAVPEPAPGSIAAAAAATAVSAESETIVASTSSQETVRGRGRSPIQTPQEEDGDEDDEYKSHEDLIRSSVEELLSDDEDENYFTCNNSVLDSEKYKSPTSPEPKSPGYQSTLGPASPWADTPSPGYNPELARAAYFGTVSDPLPIQYRENLGRRSSSSSSSRDDGTARAACEKASSGGEGAGEYACAAAAAAAAADESASHEHEGLPPASESPRHQHQQHQHHDATPQARPASLLGSAHGRVSHTGSCCCSCRAREAWSHGVGAQR